MKRKWTLIAILLVGVAFTAYFINFALGPRTLRVAVGPIGSPNVRLIVGFLQALQRERANLRLRLILTEGTESSSKAMEEGRADLAVVRSDIAVPPGAGTVAILRSDALYFITRPGSHISKMRDLRGKTIGLASTLPVNAALLARVLGHYGIETSEVTLVQGSAQEVLAKAAEGAFEAVFIVAPSSDRAGRAAFQAMLKAGEAVKAGAATKRAEPVRPAGSPPEATGDDDEPAEPAKPSEPAKPGDAGKPGESEPGILAIGQAEAIVEEAPGFSTMELVRGSIGSDPPRPEEATTTLAVTHRLVAQRSLDETQVSDLTRLLFTLRLVIARETPAANEIELPSTDDRGSRLPVHAGTIAYVEGETKTFFERFGDWFYIGIMAFSLLGSLAAAIWSRVVAARHPLDIDEEQGELLYLINTVRECATLDALKAMKPDLDARRSRLLAVITAAPMDSAQAANLRFLLTELREAYLERLADFALPASA